MIEFKDVPEGEYFQFDLGGPSCKKTSAYGYFYNFGDEVHVPEEEIVVYPAVFSPE